MCSIPVKEIGTDKRHVFCVVSRAQPMMGAKAFVDQCWDMINSETEEAVKTERFTTIERSLLEESQRGLVVQSY